MDILPPVSSRLKTRADVSVIYIPITKKEDFCVQQRTHENWDVWSCSPEREGVIVLSSIFYYSVNTVIWCSESEQENSLDCLSHEMDIWQSMCVTPAIYGIPETVITYISDYQEDRKPEINNLIHKAAGIWAHKSTPDSTTRHCENAALEYAGFQSAQWQSSGAVNYSMIAILLFKPGVITFHNMVRIFTRNQVSYS